MTSADRRPGGWLGRKRVMAAAAAVFLLSAWGFAGEYSRNRELSAEIVSLQSQASGLEAANVLAAQQSRDLASDQAAEREARMKLGLMRPGEEVVVIRGEPSPASADELSAAPAPVQLPIWRKWLKYFFH